MIWTLASGSKPVLLTQSGAGFSLHKGVQPTGLVGAETLPKLSLPSLHPGTGLYAPRGTVHL